MIVRSFRWFRLSAFGGFGETEPPGHAASVISGRPRFPFEA